MRIGFDGIFSLEPATGVGQSVLALWQQFNQEPAVIDPILLLPGPAQDLPQPPAANMLVQEPPPRLTTGKARKIWWEQIGLPQAAARARVDLVHVPYHSTPLLRRRPYIVTIHDLVPLAYPVYLNSRSMRLYFRFACLTARGADLILTDSKHSAADIHQYLSIPQERIRAIPLAAAAQYQPLPADDPRLAALRAKYGLTGPIIFNISGLDVRKNQTALIRGFGLVRDQLPPATRLVIGGAAHTRHPDRYPDLQRVAAEAGVSAWTVFPGRISDEEKLLLLNLATVYVDPSLYEGFGISPLEAMQCGTPTIAANRSSLPEVVGGGGLLVEPTPDDIGAALVRLLNDPARLAELRERGRAQAAQFSWQQTARQTLAAYADVLTARRQRRRRR